MRLGLVSTAIAAAFAVPSTANAVTFTFDAAHPAQLSAQSDLFGYSYFSQALGINGQSGTAVSAPYSVSVFYFNEDTRQLVQSQPSSGIAPATGQSYNFATAMVMSQYGRFADFLFTFTTTTDQTILISGLEGFRPPPQGGPGSTVEFRLLPEPATWMLMLTGFGMIGALVRSRSKLILALA